MVVNPYRRLNTSQPPASVAYQLQKAHISHRHTVLPTTSCTIADVAGGPLRAVSLPAAKSSSLLLSVRRSIGAHVATLRKLVRDYRGRDEGISTAAPSSFPAPLHTSATYTHHHQFYSLANMNFFSSAASLFAVLAMAGLVLGCECDAGLNCCMKGYVQALAMPLFIQTDVH